MTNPSFSDLLSVIERHAHYDYLTQIDGLKVGRTDSPSEVGHSIYQPSFGLVARGVKELMVGETAFRYADGKFPTMRGRRSGHVAGHRGAPFRALPRDPPRDRSCSRSARSPPRAVGRPAKGRRPLDRRQVYARSRPLRPIDPTGLLAGAAARHPGHGAVDPARDRLEPAAYGAWSPAQPTGLRQWPRDPDRANNGMDQGELRRSAEHPRARRHGKYERPRASIGTSRQ